MPPIHIAIAEDNVFLMQAIKEKLSFFDEFKVVCTALNGELLLQELEKDRAVDLILMDIEMPKLNGIAATQIVKQKYPQIKVIILTVFDDYDNIFNAIRAGANGYLLKEVNPDDLQKGIQETLNGGAAMTPIIAQKTLQLLRNPRIQVPKKPTEDFKLTKREIEVLEQLGQGLSHTQIAANFSRSPKTIRNHIEKIYKKLHVHSKIEAVQKAKNNYLI